MYVADFSGCWAKIKRAKHHRDMLDAYLGEIVTGESNRPVIGIKFKPETGRHVLYVSHMPETLTQAFRDCALFLGDIFHNLRSALDHLVFQLALKNTNGNIKFERRLQFPIEDKVSVFDGRCTERRSGDPAAWIAELHREDQAIIKRFQPDGGTDGGLLLARLRDFSNTDKHQLLMPIALVTQEVSGTREGGGWSMIIAMTWFAEVRRTNELISFPKAELGAELFSAQLPQGIHIEMEMAGYVTPNILIEAKQGFTEPVAAADKIAAEVISVLRKFDPLP